MFYFLLHFLLFFMFYLLFFLLLLIFIFLFCFFFKFFLLFMFFLYFFILPFCFSSSWKNGSDQVSGSNTGGKKSRWMLTTLLTMDPITLSWHCRVEDLKQRDVWSRYWSLGMASDLRMFSFSIFSCLFFFSLYFCFCSTPYSSSSASSLFSCSYYNIVANTSI